MPSTDDYQRAFDRTRRQGALTEDRQVHPGTLAEEACPECGQDPCICDQQEQDELQDTVPRESLEVLEILAATDPHTFSFLVECEGLRVAALRDRDPLAKAALAEDVQAVAMAISENPDEPDYELDQYRAGLQELAQDYGYCVHVPAK